jgi:hypothetical protein
MGWQHHNDWVRGGGQPRSGNNAFRGRRAMDNQIGPRACGRQSWRSGALSRCWIGEPPPGQRRVHGNQSSKPIEVPAAGWLAQRQREERPPFTGGARLIESGGGRFGSSSQQEGGCNTPCYVSPNLSLITIISGLVMHDVIGLINSESSQRHFLFNLNLNH